VSGTTLDYEPSLRGRAIRVTLACLALWALVCGLGFWEGMSPRPILVALTVVAVVGVLTVYADVSGRTSPPDWHMEDAGPVGQRGQDPRLAMLERVVTHHLVGHEVSSGLHDHLVRLVDARLLARHGLTWTADPGRAEVWVGPDLHRFAESTAPYPRLTPAQINALIDRIETL
jgi:hypothetical protein